MPHPNFSSASLLLLCVILSIFCAVVCADLLLKGGTVVNGDASFRADVLVRGRKIAEVKPEISLSSSFSSFFSSTSDVVETVDCTDLLIFPGAIDPHTHLDAHMMGTVTSDDFFTGTSAALAGGTTTVIDFALPRAGDGDLIAGLDDYEVKASRDAACDFSFHMAITNWSSKIESQLVEIAKTRGVNSFKFFLAYKNAFAVDDDVFLKGLEACRRVGALAMVHCENADAVDLWQRKVVDAGVKGPEGHPISRPSILEDQGTARALSLAALAGAPLYVVHVMSAGAAALIGAARNGRGISPGSVSSNAHPQRVWGEAVVSGIAGDDSKVFDTDFRVAAAHVMSPPIRSAKHREALRAALAGGDLSVLGTDHAVFNASQKAAGMKQGGDFRFIPNGVNGIEERVVVAFDSLVAGGGDDFLGSTIPENLATASRLVELVSAAPAKLFGLYPRKGRIAVGSDADLVVFDPKGTTEIGVQGKNRKHHSRVDVNIYEGRRVKGRVARTIFGGRVVWDGERLTARRGEGRRLELKPFAEEVFGGMERTDEGDDEKAMFLRRWESEFPYSEGLPVERRRQGGQGREEL